MINETTPLEQYKIKDKTEKVTYSLDFEKYQPITIFNQKNIKPGLYSLKGIRSLRDLMKIQKQKITKKLKRILLN